MKEKIIEKSKALRDEEMSSPSDIRNTTAPRKVKDMPEDEGYKQRNPEKDYDGPTKKDH
ncbi:MAG: hypothetical protein ABIP44_08905 [Pseudoxanthomonas sp.]